MNNKSLVSKTRQRTKGGSLPTSFSAPNERRKPARLGADRDLRSGRGQASCATEDFRSRGVSMLLRRTILQLFSSKNGIDEVAENGGSGASEKLFTDTTPEAASFGRNGGAIDERSGEDVAAESLGRFPLWKRILDLSLVVLTMCIWLPLMMIIMSLIKIVSPGPALYQQRRIGFRGGPFMIFKFRSMKVNAETQTHEDYVERLMQSETPLTKLDASDPRLISFGRLLRATGLDELPQLFNVLRGEMSLVGPRPCTDLEFARYAPWQKARVEAPPGLTGYWQVNGKNKTTFNQMMRMDLHYVRNMSLQSDLAIICKTFPAILEQTRESFARKSSKSHGREPIADFAGRHCDRSVRRS